MAEAVIVEFKDFNKFCGLKVKYFRLPKVSLTVYCNEQVEKDVGKDPLWQQKIVNAVQKEVNAKKAKYCEIAEDIDQKIAMYYKARKKPMSDKEVETLLRSMQAQDERIQKDLRECVDKIEQGATEAVIQGWNDILKVKKQWKSYKLKARANLLYSGGVLVADIATTAVAGGVTMGAGGIVGLVATAKTVASIGSQLRDICKSAEGVLKTLDQDMANLMSRYENQKPLVANARELGSQILNDFFSVKLLNSIENCTKNAEEAKGKIAGIVSTSHDASEQLNKLLKSSEAFEKKVAKLEGDPKKGKQAKKAVKKLENIERKIDSQITRVGEQDARGKAAGERLDQLLPLLEEVKKKDSQAVRAIAKVVKLGTGFAMSIAGADTVGEGIVEELEKLQQEMIKDEIVEKL